MFEAMIRQWMAEAGSGLEIVFIQKMMDQSITSVEESDKWYSALKKAFDKVSFGNSLVKKIEL